MGTSPSSLQRFSVHGTGVGLTSMVRFLGQSGIDAMTRIFGFLLICIGMQFLLSGIGDFFSVRPV